MNQESLVEALFAIQKQQQECIKCIARIIANGGIPAASPVDHVTAPVASDCVIKTRRPRRTHEDVTERELRKACRTKHAYRDLCHWRAAELEPPYILIHRNRPLLAQRFADYVTPIDAVDDSQSISIVPTQIIPNEDEIEVRCPNGVLCMAHGVV
eukprot:Gregarina_sp_Poly_1__2116@NODE_155_length_12405_cov_134_674339_g137_i0_p6_GENE_NODE_155_length_12405_cov_134_674339_g137_i0NODE_155_length_12405_cov_134_674339_g137_i0_p6_ORF_typecomplete_len155_score10_18DUF772/PF05598_11/0_069_NODE_155_length_12405_cov_134_674339_g137_i028323296